MCQVGASVVAVVVGDSTAAMAASSHFAEDRLEVGPRCAPAERPLLATTGPRALVCSMSGGSSRGRAGAIVPTGLHLGCAHPQHRGLRACFFGSLTSALDRRR